MGPLKLSVPMPTCVICDETIAWDDVDFKFGLCGRCWHRKQQEGVFDNLCQLMLRSSKDKVLIQAIEALNAIQLRHNL